MNKSHRCGLISLLALAVARTALAGGLLVPSYEYPSDGGAYGDDWYQYAATASYLKTNGNVGFNQLICIGNPNSGPGTSEDPNYLSAFTAVRSAGGQIVGYVNTQNGTLSLTSVESQINTWISFYGKQLDGIFLDNWRGYESGNIPGSNPTMTYATYYGNLQTYIKKTKKLSLCVGNPGETFTNSSAAKLADILCIHEDYYSNGTNWTVPSWVKEGGYAQGCAIYHDMPLSDETTESSVITDTLVTKSLSWVYVTDDTIAHDGGYSILPGVLSGYGSDGEWNQYWGNEEYTVGAS